MPSEFRFAFNYLKGQRFLFAYALVSRALWELLPMQVPILTGALVDALSGKEAVIYGFTIPFNNETFVQGAGITLIVVAVLYGISAYFYTMGGSYLGRQFTTDMRDKIAKKVLNLSLDFHQTEGSGVLLDRTLSDPNKLRSFTKRVFIRSITNSIRVLYPLTMLFLTDIRLTLIVLAPMPFQLGITWWLQKKQQIATREALDNYSELTNTINEHWDGIETIKSLNAAAVSEKQIHEANAAQEDLRVETDRLTAFTRAFTWFLTTLGLALGWWFGGLMVIEGTLTIGALITFTGFVDFIYRPLRRFTTILNTYRKGAAAINRMEELLDEKSSTADIDAAQKLDAQKGAISFDAVGFSYDDDEDEDEEQEKILRDISIDIQPQTITAIVGRSGSGKSTILRLIARLYHHDEGDIQLDGQDVDETARDSLRQKVSVIPQKPVLFSGTVRDNVIIGKQDASDDEVWDALDKAHAKGFIEALDDGLDTKVGRKGTFLSGGQIQRISIARALLRQPLVLLLDEPTASLDNESEQEVVEALHNLREEMSIVMVTHDLNAIKDVDKILIVNDGQIAEKGSYDKLSQKSDLFRQIFDMENQEQRDSQRKLHEE